MYEKRIKFIYFSTSGSQVKEVSLGPGKLALYLSVLLFFLSGVVALTLQITTNLFQDVELSRLSKKNTELANMLSVMEQRVVDIETKVRLVEKQDNDLRIFADIPKIDNDTRQLGVGGLDEETFSTFAYSNDDRLQKAFKIRGLLNNLSQRMDLAYKSRNDIVQAYRERDENLAHLPSVTPVPEGRIKSRFGYRTDPFTQKQSFHDGLDLAAPRGTEIYAAADGVVLSTVTRYSPYKGYGKQVVIDHGNGVKTRYAHMRNIQVKEGEKISRFTVIGTVGTTGRSTGPHLHYEVIVDNKPVNPLNYIFD